jgi:pilus assembly protein CpaB
VKIRLISTLAALVLAIVGAMLIASYVGAADRRAFGEAETMEVFVVTEPIPAGTATEDLGAFLEVTAVPRAVIAEDVVTNLSQFDGRVVGVNLVVGEMLLASRLVDPLSLAAPGSVPAPEGYQEFTVLLAPEAAVGGRVAAGDTVGIYVTLIDGAASGLGAGLATHHVFHRVLVTSVQGATAQAEEAAAAAALPEGSVYVTFAAPAVDAERIIFADQYGSLWLSLETEDDIDEGTKWVTGENFEQ